MSENIPKVLITGWFSFESPHNTAGDLLARRVLADWLNEGGYKFDVGVFKPKTAGEVDIQAVIPTDYIAVIFVCGPITSGHVTPLMRRFADIKRIAVNVSVVPTSDLREEFDHIIARDSLNDVNPDMVLLSKKNVVPVIGLIYAGKQKEYPNQEHDYVERIVSEVLGPRDIAVVLIDTKLPYNEYGLNSIGQIESVISKMDAVITTRLHGTVLSLKNGVPPIVIDPVPGGEKVARQATILEWPLACTVDQLTKDWLGNALTESLEKEMSNNITEHIQHGISLLKITKKRLLEALES